MTDSDALFVTVKNFSPQQYCTVYAPNLTFSGGLPIYCEVKKQHYEPIEDEE